MQHDHPTEDQRPRGQGRSDPGRPRRTPQAQPTHRLSDVAAAFTPRAESGL